MLSVAIPKRGKRKKKKMNFGPWDRSIRPREKRIVLFIRSKEEGGLWESKNLSPRKKGGVQKRRKGIGRRIQGGTSVRASKRTLQPSGKGVRLKGKRKKMLGAKTYDRRCRDAEGNRVPLEKRGERGRHRIGRRRSLKKADIRRGGEDLAINGGDVAFSIKGEELADRENALGLKKKRQRGGGGEEYEGKEGDYKRRQLRSATILKMEGTTIELRRIALPVPSSEGKRTTDGISETRGSRKKWGGNADEASSDNWSKKKHSSSREKKRKRRDASDPLPGADRRERRTRTTTLERRLASLESGMHALVQGGKGKNSSRQARAIGRRRISNENERKGREALKKSWRRDETLNPSKGEEGRSKAPPDSVRPSGDKKREGVWSRAKESAPAKEKGAQPS